MPKAAVRGWAWIAGVLAFLAPWAALRANPMPEATTTAAQGNQVRPLVVRTIVRRVIVVAEGPGSVQAGATRTGTGGSQSQDAPADTDGGGAPPPQPPPVSTGGS
jgi:hypothetical protein